MGRTNSAESRHWPLSLSALIALAHRMLLYISMAVGKTNQTDGRTLRRTCSRLVPAEPDRFIGYFCLVQSLPVKDRCLYSGLVSFSFPYPDASGKEIHKVIRGAMALSCCWLIAYNSPLATAPSPLIYKKPASRVTTELLCVRRDRGTRDPSSPH